jgi:branched-chain amino acid transport system permease protein
MELARNFLFANIKNLVSQEIIEEHARNPIGQHSDALQKVLVYLKKRQFQTLERDVIVCIQPYYKFCLCKIYNIRGIPPKISEDECFTSVEEAEHYIFIKRLKESGLF